MDLLVKSRSAQRVELDFSTDYSFKVNITHYFAILSKSIFLRAEKECFIGRTKATFAIKNVVLCIVSWRRI